MRQNQCTTAGGRSPEGVGANVAAAEGAATAAVVAPGLDKKGDNRFGPEADWIQDVADGEVVLSAERSGGPFDPLGGRVCDRNRADDLVALVDAFKGRWVMVTLTMKRKAWTCPEAGYERCKERVRRVGQVLSPRGVWFRTMELQTKTGEGWPHWHVLAWAPDDRSVAELRQEVKKAWRVRTERVNQDTGEVTLSCEQVGFVDVEEARTREGVGRYVAKYVMKRWPAVPRWMGRSVCRFRKFGASPGAYEAWERLHRHVVVRGRRKPAGGVRRRVRTLFERMARSGSRCLVWEKRAGLLHVVATVAVPVFGLAVLPAWAGARAVRLGKWPAVRVAMPRANLGRLRAEYEGRGESRAYVRRRVAEFEGEWSRMQRWRRADDEMLCVLADGRPGDDDGPGWADLVSRVPVAEHQGSSLVRL